MSSFNKSETISTENSNISNENKSKTCSSLNSEAIVPKVKTTTIERVVETKKRNVKKVLNFDFIPNDKTPQVIRPQNDSNDENSFRRSKRTRFPRLNFWCGQRPVFTRESNGITDQFVAINKGSQEVVKERKKFTKTDNKGVKRNAENSENDNKSNKRSKNVFDLSLHEKVFEEIFKQNETNRREPQNSDCIKFLNDLNWIKSKQNDGVMTALIRKNRSNGEAVGMLKLGPMAQKTRSLTGDYVTHMTVTYGALGLKIENNSEVIVKTNTYFRVDKRTNYSIKNCRNDSAVISFVILKD
jgi:hypothetical protein